MDFCNVLVRLQLQPFLENVEYDELPWRVHDLLFILHRKTLICEANSPFVCLLRCIIPAIQMLVT